LNILVQHPGRQFKAIEGRRTPYTTAHSAIQYHLDLILLLTVNKSWRWGWHRPLARDGIRKRGGQLDQGEYRVKAAELGGES
jgi:hypothetical protein